MPPLRKVRFSSMTMDVPGILRAGRTVSPSKMLKFVWSGVVQPFTPPGKPPINLTLCVSVTTAAPVPV